MDESTNTALPGGESPGFVKRYLQAVGHERLQPGAVAFWAAIDQVGAVQPSVAEAIVQELRDQRANLKLIASENYASLATQLAHANLFTDKYAEGYPGHRFYAGCDNVDAVEAQAARLACQLFGAEHAYVQPHSGADANLVAFLAILATRVELPALTELGETDPTKVTREQWQGVRSRLHDARLLGMDYYSGGHLTHGYRRNVSSQLFDVYTYTTDRSSKLLDLDTIRAQVREIRPLVLLAGYSAYSRKIDFAALREFADEVGAVFMVDMAHFSGLVAGGVFTGNFDPVPHAHVVTSTTHKTLRGPRGGFVLATGEFADAVDKGCPTILGGPLPHVLAAKAVAFTEANRSEFRSYAQRIVVNAQALAEQLVRGGLEVLTGGTDNHIVLVDVASGRGLTGRQAESALRACGITLNRNALPFDAEGPWYTSGLRLGTAAATTLGMGPAEMAEIADVIRLVIDSTRPGKVAEGSRKGQPSKVRYELSPAVVDEARARIGDLLDRHPLYPELDLGLLDEARQPAPPMGSD